MQNIREKLKRRLSHKDENGMSYFAVSDYSYIVAFLHESFVTSNIQMCDLNPLLIPRVMYKSQHQILTDPSQFRRPRFCR